MEEEVKGIADYLDLIRRRKYWVIFPTLILMLATISVAYLLPKTFKSEGVILIESQEIPNDLVRSTVTSYADQRIEVIKQRIMTTKKAMEIVNKYKLYPEYNAIAPASQIVTMFRDNITVIMVKANVTDPRNGRTQKSSIAFKVAFMDKSPLIAQQVANELVTEFLNENVRTRSGRAADTKVFLEGESNKFERKVQLLEMKIAEFKDQYSDSLPELLEYNLSMVEALQQELASNQHQIVVLQDQVLAMNLELSNLIAYIDDSVPPSLGLKPTILEQQLQLAKAEYSKLSAKYSTNHPNVMQLKRQIDSLQAELGIDGSDVDNLTIQLEQAKENLTQQSQRYSANHPDINSVKDQINLLQKQLTTAELKQAKTNGASIAPAMQDTRKINPIYLQIKSQVDISNRQILHLRNRQDEITTKLTDFEKRVFQTYQVERAYNDLTRDHATNIAKYQELRDKQLEAELAHNLELENKGESFTLIEPPQLPIKTEKPNRPKIMALGFIFSLVVGIGLAFLIEMLKGGVRGYNEITRILGQAPLVVIPMISTLQNVNYKKSLRVWLMLLSFLLLVLLIISFHRFVMPLEVLWFKIVHEVTLL